MEGDQRLLEDCLAGRAGAWERLLSAHGAFALGLAGERLRRAGYGVAEAEEVVQEVWVAFLEHGGRRLLGVDASRGFRPYLAAAVLNAARAWLRGRERRRMREAALSPSLSPDVPEEPLLKAESQDRLTRAFSGMAPDDQLLLRWVYWEGLSYAQVARLRGLQENSIGSLLTRARKRLKEALDKI